jgi:DNA-binding transcriptional ArsR family regulator
MKKDPFQAIADPTRRAILVMIAMQAMTPNALAEHFDSTRQGVSKHIRYLADCDLVTKQQDGREIWYKVNPVKMKEMADWMEPFAQLWETRFNQLDEVLKKSKKDKS